MNILKRSLRNILPFLLLPILVASCDNNDIPAEVKEINWFVYQQMSNYYLWNDEMPNKNPDAEPDTEDFFYSLLYGEIDRWSFITDDAEALYNYFAGVRKEFGYSLRGYARSDGRVYALIEYVEPNGPADKAGLKRGDMIVKWNGGEITKDNYGDLFYSETGTVGLGTISNGELVDLDPTINVVAEEIQVNPILETKVFDVQGTKIGYLAYTSFIYDYNEELEEVFAGFKAEGVTELILDLRYNGGGAVATARLMASMICPSNAIGEVFLRTAYNEGLEEAIIRENPTDYVEWFEDYFEDNANNLNLSNLYVLTTEGTASASEMVIYSLSPYMDVVQIGEQTHGKYYGSITIDDKEKHNWAIQPIIMRAENVDNSINYAIGLQPQYEMEDDVTYELGTEEDVLTAEAISLITGVKSSQPRLKSADLLGLKSSKELMKKQNPLKYEMYIDKK